MPKKNITKWGYICKYTKAIKDFGGENTKIRWLHPIGFITLIFCFSSTPFVASFCDQSTQELCAEINQYTCWW